MSSFYDQDLGFFVVQAVFLTLDMTNEGSQKKSKTEAPACVSLTCAGVLAVVSGVKAMGVVMQVEREVKGASGGP